MLKPTHPNFVTNHFLTENELTYDSEIRRVNVEKCDTISERARGTAQIFIQDDKRIMLNDTQMAVVDFLLECPVEMRARIMQISEEEMDNLILERIKKRSELLFTLLQKQWYYRDSSEYVDFDLLKGIVPLFGNKEAMKKKCKRLSFTLKEVNSIIEHFINPRTEYFYMKRGDKIILFDESDL